MFPDQSITSVITDLYLLSPLNSMMRLIALLAGYHKNQQRFDNCSNVRSSSVVEFFLYTPPPKFKAQLERGILKYNWIQM